MYHKKSLLDEDDTDEEEGGGGMGREKSASQFRDDYAKHQREDEEARVGEGVDASPREAVRNRRGGGRASDGRS